MLKIQTVELTDEFLLTERVVHNNCTRMTTECQLIAAVNVHVLIEDPQLGTASVGLLLGGYDVVLSRDIKETAR